MLTETLVSTILTASITGAGLLLAIYALITPISRKIFEERVKLLRKKKSEFDKLKEKISSESSDKDFERLKTLATEIKGIKMFPRYLGFGVLVVFSCYIFTTVFAFGWLMNPTQDIMKEYVMTFLFLISTFGFTVVGYFAITDVYRAMKGEFESLKKEQQEVEKVSKEIERISSEHKKKGIRKF